MRRAFRGFAISLALACGGCWDFAALSNGDSGTVQEDASIRDLGLADFAVRDLTTPPDLTPRTLRFTPPAPVSASRPVDLVVGDFDGDGHLDFATLSFNLHNVTLFHGNGDGTVSAGVDHAIGGNAVSFGFGSGDFNGDGFLDLAIPLVGLLAGDGTGNFTLFTPWGAPTQPSPGTAVADIDGNGKLDLVTAAANMVTVFNGKGDGTFPTAVPFISGPNAAQVIATDLDRDGKPDVAVADADANQSSIAVFHNDGNGGLKMATLYNTAAKATSLAASDVDKDGWIDLVATTDGDQQVIVLRGRSGGTFVQAPKSYAAGMGLSGIAAADLDGDTFPDLVACAHGDSALSILTSRGDGTFNVLQIVLPGGAPGRVAIADLDEDGMLDLIVLLPEANQVAILLNASTLQ